MKTTKLAAIGAASTLAVVALLLAFPAMAAVQSASTTTSIIPSPTALTVGQTITFTSTSGVWHVLPSATATGTKSGTAAGTMTLTVTGVYAGGYSLSLTSGSVSINGTTYAFGTGSAVMGPHQAHLVGQGALAAATPGSFLFAAGAHANFHGQTYNTLRLDVKANGEEYGVVLLVTATFS